MATINPNVNENSIMSMSTHEYKELKGVSGISEYDDGTGLVLKDGITRSPNTQDIKYGIKHTPNSGDSAVLSASMWSRGDILLMLNNKGVRYRIGINPEKIATAVLKYPEDQDGFVEKQPIYSNEKEEVIFTVSEDGVVK